MPPGLGGHPKLTICDHFEVTTEGIRPIESAIVRRSFRRLAPFLGLGNANSRFVGFSW
jgi:hypothetical protein